MPWRAPSGNTYLLCLLDTNALSEILKNPISEGRGFIEKYGYPPDKQKRATDTVIAQAELLSSEWVNY